MTTDSGKSGTPHPCADGEGGFDHDWEWVRDWYGDPGVINGTADCSGWVCKRCDSTKDGEPPDDYYDPEEWV